VVHGRAERYIVVSEDHFCGIEPSILCEVLGCIDDVVLVGGNRREKGRVISTRVLAKRSRMVELRLLTVSVEVLKRVQDITR
jgi:hypothetical protein